MPLSRNLRSPVGTVLAGGLVLAALAVAVVLRLAGSGAVPQAFVDRTPMPPCGEVAVRFEQPEGPEVECFDEALRAERPAEVVVSSTTAEGDRVVTYYRSVPGEEGLEYWLDATQDAFGSGGWEHVRCLHGTGIDDHWDCRPA